MNQGEKHGKSVEFESLKLKRETIINLINKRQPCTEQQVPDLGQVQTNDAGSNVLIGANLHPNHAFLWYYNLSHTFILALHRACFSLTVNDVFTLNSSDIRCVLIDILVLDT